MAQVELIMPKMGESIMEATILKWVKNVGDAVDVDETILEIATDKVDSEVPSPVKGVIKEILFQENDVVEIEKYLKPPTSFTARWTYFTIALDHTDRISSPPLPLLPLAHPSSV